jgi:hypothetical protein
MQLALGVVFYHQGEQEKGLSLIKSALNKDS